MDQRASERLNQLMASIETEWNIAVALFIALGLMLALIVKRRNNLTFKDTALFAVGLKKVKTTWTEKILHAATILIPLAILVFGIQSKNAT